MCSILFFATFFNLQSGLFTSDETVFLIGPDSYYNLRLCEQTMETGAFPFVSQNDPLLNYPLTDDAGRPPVFTMIAVGATALVQTVSGLSTLSALNLCMLFLPAIYGALLVIPTYFLGKELFNQRIGLISALLLSIIPLHILPAHGCTLGLFDHDSFLLLLTITFLYFLVKTFKQHPDNRKYYIALSSITLATIYLTWTSGYAFGFVLILSSAFLFLFYLIKQSPVKKDLFTINYITTIAFMIYFPYGVQASAVTYFAIPPFITACITFITLLFHKFQVKRTTQLMITSLSAFLTLALILLAKPKPLLNIIEKLTTGIYGSPVFQTIAEGQIMSLSSMLLHIGPLLYILFFIGITLYLLKTYYDHIKVYHIIFLTFLLYTLWTTTQAGRFLNDLVPYIALLSAFTLFFIGQKVYQTNKSKIKRYALTSFVFILVASNTVLTIHAALPHNITQETFGMQGLWGHSMTQEQHWTYAMNYLSNRDIHIEKPAQRPGVISWWDYGFFIISLGSHPSVADNFQNGIKTAAQFLTSQSDNTSLQILRNRTADTSNATIKYAIVTERDLNDIYRVFPTMCNKSIDTFIQTIYQDQNTGTNYTLSQLQNMTYEQRLPLNLEMIEQYQPAYYNSTAYKIYHNQSSIWKQIYNENGIVISELQS